MYRHDRYTFGEFTWGFKDVCFGVTVELAGGDAVWRPRDPEREASRVQFPGTR